jgi:phosphatidylglycerol---prolipoprotein diacylglyceryl transferase
MEFLHPVAFRIPIPFLDTSLEFTWYGISIVVGVVVATMYAAHEAKRRGENPDNVWDMFIALVAIGIVGARIWYIVTATLGGNMHYVQNPMQIFNIRAGGTNIFGAIMAGILTVIVFCRIRKLNPWMYLDFVGPGVLLGQGLARWGNFVNQELYGQPTMLPWGIPIDALHRIAPYNDLALYPLSTRFHPAFLYETIYDLLAFAVLVYLIRRLGDRWKMGSIFGAYLVLHGLGRFFIEYFRPDQPRIVGTDISFSRALTVLFMLCGAAIIYYHQTRGQPYPAPADGANDLPAADLVDGVMEGSRVEDAAVDVEAFDEPAIETPPESGAPAE